jgi:beta-lactamase regulating signal transducer with metallopeptidase domain
MKANAMWLLSHTAGVLLLMLLVVALCRWRSPGPAGRHALWLLVLLKLLVPPLVAWPWPIPVLPGETADPARRSVASHDEGSTSPGEHEPTALPPVSLSPAGLSDIAISPQGHGEPLADERWAAIPWDRLRLAGAAVWLGGGAAVALVQWRRLRRLRRLLTAARPGSDWLVAEVGRWAAELGIRPPRLMVLPGLGSPFIWAGGRACLLWPEGLEAELSPEGCRAVLVHELAHLARRDHWVGRLLWLAACVWWWHPLFYVIRRQLHRQAELACDARVVALLPEARRSYAEALLDVCQRQSWSAAVTPALGATGRRRDLERRLVMIMRANVPGRLSLRLLVGIVLLGGVVLPAWTLGQDRTTAKPSSAPPPDAKKLQELEAKLKALLQEVQALSGSNNPYTLDGLKGSILMDFDKDGSLDILVTDLNATPAAPQEVVLSRTIYKLPAAKAEALGKFLQQHVKGVIMEAKVEGDNLIITTTPEAQQGIRQFIALIEGKLPRHSNRKLFENHRPPAK